MLLRFRARSFVKNSHIEREHCEAWCEGGACGSVSVRTHFFGCAAASAGGWRCRIDVVSLCGDTAMRSLQDARAQHALRFARRFSALRAQAANERGGALAIDRVDARPQCKSMETSGRTVTTPRFGRYSPHE